MSQFTRRDCLALAAGTSAVAGLSNCATPILANNTNYASGPPLHELASEKGIRFGSAMSARQLDDARYREIMLRECATMVAENEHKWYTIYPDPDTVNFDPADRLVAFAVENGLTMRGHTLLWHRPEW